MAVSQEPPIVLHDFEGVSASERRRTTGAGTKSRFTVEWRSEPMIASLDPVALGKGIAEAMLAEVQKDIRAINATASESTQLKRKYARTALQKGESWANARYSGGRSKTSYLPGSIPGGRKYNDSGRLADGLFVRANRDGEWTMNFPANRMDPSTFGGGMPAVAAMFKDLVSYCPTLQNAQNLFDRPAVAAAAKEAIGNVLQKQSDATRARLRAAARELAGNAQELVEATGGLAGDEG